MERFTKEELNRFNSKWRKVGECHLWTAPLDRDRYGTFFFRKVSRRAHRVAYYFRNGPIPLGMVIDHACSNRSCVNAAHLRCVTVRENSLNNSNSPAAKNALKVTCKMGHPFDKKYGSQRYCSICQSAKTKRLRRKWKDADTVAC